MYITEPEVFDGIFQSRFNSQLFLTLLLSLFINRQQVVGKLNASVTNQPLTFSSYFFFKRLNKLTDLF